MRRRAKRTPGRRKKSKVLIFLDVVIGILTAFLIFGLIGFMASRSDNYYDRKFGGSTADYAIQREDYTGLLNDYYNDYGIIGLVTPGFEENAAVAEYADAAFRYGAYLKNGEEERAARQKARMEEAAGNAGIYEPQTEKSEEIMNISI